MADLLGKALNDYFTGNQEAFLLVHTSYGEIETMPAAVFFRTYENMPDLEKYALSLCRGKILDAGAGAGSHALELQKQNLEVVALDISPKAVEIMKQRGVLHAVTDDIFTYQGGRFDTILLLMNGIGIARDMIEINYLLKHLKSLLLPGGQLLLDSCDVAYLAGANIYQHYIGEVTYQFEYRGEKSEPFGWLYLAPPMLKKVAKASGWKCQIIYEEGESYLARLIEAS
ncbi:class I SAM-dependent methyltransferase [Rhodocytophaga aerolata]|uniref:Class I SAM-dependent methyltransferase n=1 Tax=Rhodocytophaga aerolata TaxID=455078 RepID=A0ABT8R8G5_9BACT|nr:class I SAM-dependent methyltransferase [Rhodocytophaga aerolata]MDO1447986.1 class I SAM-dependent methyltransferase [Rhodocytophaga aerolata]